MGKKARKSKIVLPPELPPDLPEDEIEVSVEDVEFVKKNKKYARFVSRLDTGSITNLVRRVADVDDAELESLYQKRRQKKLEKAGGRADEDEDKERQRAPRMDPLPVKALDGTLYYRTLEDKTKEGVGHEGDGGGEGDDKTGVVRMTKAERRAKLKKSKKEAKRNNKDDDDDDDDLEQEAQPQPQAAALAEVKEDLTAEEAFESKKRKLAEFGIALLADPVSNIKSLKEMLQFCRDGDHRVVTLGLLSLLAVFKDIIPGYRIRLPTDKELEMKISKDVKKTRFYESTLLSAYKAYLQKLMAIGKNSKFQHVVVRCLCTLLDAVPHFNFRDNLVNAVVANLGSQDDMTRKLCCSTIKSLFDNEGKHGGEATAQAVRSIADLVKAHNCQLHPDSVEVFMSLSFDEDIWKSQKAEGNDRNKKKSYKKRKVVEAPNQMQQNDRKRSKKEMTAKMRDEVAAEYKAASFAPDLDERRSLQTDTLKYVFETYFRILKHAMNSTTPRPDDSSDSVITSDARPLLAPCLNGLGKFSHLIDLDYIGDLMGYLKKLAGGLSESSTGRFPKLLTVSERLQCCILAFKVMRNNLDALNVDLQGFLMQLYNLILEYKPGRDRGEVLAEALKIMLCDDRQHDMQKAAAFIKRLATFSLCVGSAESMAALVTVRHLLQRNVKCRNLLENDAGGGSVSGSIAKHQPYASDPNLSGALASVLWELNLLSKHYHPSISTIVSSIGSMASGNNQVFIAAASPLQVFTDLSLERQLSSPKFDTKPTGIKRKKGSGSSKLSSSFEPSSDASSPSEELKQKFSNHFRLLYNFKEHERLRYELARTNSELQLYEEYLKQKRKAKKPNTKSSRKSVVAG